MNIGKLFEFASNIILLGSSISLVYIAIRLLQELADTMEFAHIAGYLSVNAKMSIAISIIILALALFGFKSIWSGTKKDCYIVFALGQFAAIAVVFHHMFVINNHVYFGQDVKIFRNIYTYDLSDAIWNRMQEKYQCCGIEGYQDWHSTPFGASKITPDQCCVDYFPGCGRSKVPIHQQGCQKAVVGVIASYIYGLIGLTAVSFICSIGNSIMALRRVYKFSCFKTAVEIVDISELNENLEKQMTM